MCFAVCVFLNLIFSLLTRYINLAPLPLGHFPMNLVGKIGFEPMISRFRAGGLTTWPLFNIWGEGRESNSHLRGHNPALVPMSYPQHIWRKAEVSISKRLPPPTVFKTVFSPAELTLRNLWYPMKESNLHLHVRSMA